MLTKVNYSRRRFLRLAAGASAVTLGVDPAASAQSGEKIPAKIKIKPPARPVNTSERVVATGIEQPRMASFDHLMHSFVREQQVVGAALAVTKDSRLVYARGFGWADRDRREAVRPDSLFRIASITKPLTATAIMQLVERRRLQLDAKIFRLLELPPTKDGRWQDVTVEHLLHHTGGWDREKSFDPMFRSVVISKSLDLPPPATPQHIIRYMTQQPLDFDPGSRFVYSNFGYCLLGRVIERVSGMRYGQYVRQNVLRPLEIGRMQLGATLLDRRASQEVRYYDAKNRTGPSVFVPGGKQVPLPYGTWCLESMDAHGGWIASAVDLARFAAALDTPDECRILHRHGLDTMFARPDGPAGHESGGQPKPAYYACGWNVRAVRRSGLNTWHTGALDGTSTLLVRRHDGVNWAVLFNCREAPNGKELAGLIDPLLHTAADAVTDWPQIDYFEG